MTVVSGTSGRDVLTGQALGDVISGGEGGDTLDGGGGNDVLYGFGATDVAGGGTIDATLVASGLSRPIFAASPPGDPGRLFVAEEHTGLIKILDLATNQFLPSPFLDIPNSELTQGNEQGLLGMAFDPGYAANGIYYLSITNAAGDSEIWKYTRGANPNISSTTRELLLTYDRTIANHNGGWIGFGPDGYLYLATGDGGLIGDPANNAQNVNSLLGKILRIDVHSDGFPDDPTRNYAIPASNPYVGIDGADEVFAIGVRNPWRISFDSATGDLLIADVGQDTREEIDWVPAGTLGGRNFGWAVMEAGQVYDGARPGNPPVGSPLFTPPTLEYPHGKGAYEGFSVTGGYVLHGPDAGAQGLYVFADYVSGNVWTARLDATGAHDFTRRNDQLVVSGGTVDKIVSFAADGTGRLYVLGLDGEIHRLTFNAGAGDAADILRGGAGDDQLYGGLGDDTLDGGKGTDTMAGGAGDDVHIVDSRADLVVENAGEGRDTVLVGVSGYTLPANVENLTLLYGSDITGTGNGQDNVITGNTGANLLKGQGGADTLLGGDGADTLVGGSGGDVLTGGAGADLFQYASPSEIGQNIERITDFSPAEGDKIDLHLIDANTALTGDQAFSFIGGAAFSHVAGELRSLASGANWVVQGDVNGDGRSDFTLLLTTSPGSGDFIL